MGQFGPKFRARKRNLFLILSLFFLILCTALFVLAIIYSKGADIEVRSSHHDIHVTNYYVMKNPQEEKESIYSKTIAHLKHVHIRFLALDFDFTIINEHTGGRWKGHASELAIHVRPIFRELLEVAMTNDFYVAVVTFSSQERLISEVMTLTFPGAEREIPIYGGMDKPKKGKQSHLELATRDFELQNNEQISKESTVLIDDDERNVLIARKNGYKAVLFQPDYPLQLLHELALLN